MEIHIHIERVVIHDDQVESRILNALAKTEERILMALEELRTQLAQANEQTTTIAATLTEVASDLDDLIAKLAAGTPGSQEIADATAEATTITNSLRSTADALRAVADKHTP